MTDTEISEFMKQCLQFLVATAKKLFERSPLSSIIVKNARCLPPKYFDSNNAVESLKSLQKHLTILKVLPSSTGDKVLLQFLSLLDGLNIIDASHFTGSQKLCFLQDWLIPPIQSPILIYEVPISLAFKLEQKSWVYIWKWIKFNNSITSWSFYSSASPCPLPIRSFTSILNSSKISWHLVLKVSHDQLVSSCVQKLQEGNWQVMEAVQTCKTDLRHKSLIGHHHHSPHELGYIKILKFHLANHLKITGMPLPGPKD